MKHLRDKRKRSMKELLQGAWLENKNGRNKKRNLKE